MLLLAFFLLIVGFALLVKGADWLVDGASALALRLHIKPIVIGLTVVAFGTSAPELIVNVLSALKGANDIAFGNIIGSNIVNILLILGVAAAIRPLKTQHNTIWREIPYSMLAIFVLFVMVNDSLFSEGVNLLARNDALILLCFFGFFLIYNFAIAQVQVVDFRPTKQLSVFKMTVLILIGLAGLFLGGKLAVENAVIIARAFGISDKVVGLTIVALGTSLPELFTSAVASFKKKDDIAVGNVVGSNIFNIFFVLGCTGIIRDLPYNPSINFDFLVLTFASLLFFFSSFVKEKGQISRREGWLFIVIYLVYTAYLFITK